jgi:murein DD-endopeptidase MepM/ murein hydrolase activator NlpD
MRFPRLFAALSAILLALVVTPVATAQDDEPYVVVQEGDTLWQIAARFGISPDELQQANNINDPGQVSIGARLVIPGLNGVSGQIDTMTVLYGDTLRSISLRHNISQASLALLNHLISPSEVYAGASLIVPVSGLETHDAVGKASPGMGQSLLELAVLSGKNPWALGAATDVLGTQNPRPALPEEITNVEIDPVQMIQGGTTIIKVYAPNDLRIRGSLAQSPLNFFPQPYGFVALQGVHAMTPPGLYPLSLEGELSDGKRFRFSQNVLIGNANFPSDPTLEVDPVTVDPSVTEPEKQLWESLAVPVTPEKMWNDLFSSPVPVDFKDCWTSLFGNRRSYNNGPYESFHSGLDFCGTVGTELYAVAPGKVTYTDTLIVRGGVVVIDHGWGVYTAYDHLSEILVQPGDIVRTGQVIGLGGDTGRTTGPHLHWEVWVGGVQVNPVDWLSRSFP